MDRNDQEKELLGALSRGEQKAFDCLFRRYYPMLCAYARRFVREEDAEEIVQEIMLWLWEKRQDIMVEISLPQYLFKITYHRALNLIARQEVSARADTRFYTKHQELPSDIDHQQIEELGKRINEAVAALPESYRTAFVMHRFKNMSYKEIATELNVSPKTIDYRIQQALKQLRRDLKEYLPLVSLLFADDFFL